MNGLYKKIIYYTFKYVALAIVSTTLISVCISLINAKSDLSVILGVVLLVAVILANGIIYGKDILRVIFVVKQHSARTKLEIANDDFQKAIDDHLKNIAKSSEVKKKKSPGRPRKITNNKKV